MDPERTQGIRDFPPPRDAKGIARFVGMVNFYRRFIPNAAEIAAPLNELRTVSYTHLDVYKRQVYVHTTASFYN